jgi:hypothetical protein
MGEHKRPRRHVSLYKTRLRQELRLGVLVGLGLSALYCAYALVLFALRGNAPFEANDVPLAGVLATYVAGGLAGGTIYGLLHPFARFALGRALLGAVIGTIVFCGIYIVTDGLPHHWARRTWENVGLAGLMLGVPIGLLWRSVVDR